MSWLFSRWIGQGVSLHVCFSEPDDPSVVHSSPPCCGAGLSHARVLSISPPPQVTGHCDHVLHSPQPPLTGHGFSLHRSVSTFVEPSIVQSSPPCSGIGLLHSRYRLCSEPPQDTGHSSQSPKLPHPH